MNEYKTKTKNDNKHAPNECRYFLESNLLESIDYMF